MAPRRVLSTKALDASLIEYAAGSQVQLQVKEFISVVPIDTEQSRQELRRWLQIPGTCMAFTSANAADQIPVIADRQLLSAAHPRICCLSGKTKQRLQEIFTGADGWIVADNASALAVRIIAEGVKEIIFICGNRRRDELPEILKKSGVALHELVVYQTLQTPSIVKEEFDGILFFSPSAVESFFSVNQPAARTVCFAIGDTTAASLKEHTTNKVVVSGSASASNIIATMTAYFSDQLN